MKYILILISCSCFLSHNLFAQNVDQQPRSRQPRVYDTTLAHRITEKLADSLSLSTQQRLDIMYATHWIEICKINIINQFHGKDSLNIYMDQAEHLRDSSYQSMLTAKQFEKYVQHKTILVLNN